MKFIIIEKKIDEDLIQFIPIIFPNFLVHKIVYEESIKIIRLHSNKPIFVKCISAGEYNGSKCFGESKSLGIKCHQNSLQIIKMIDYIQFFDKNENPLT